MDFPEIAFNFQKAGNIGIESISLENLYARAHVVEPSPVTPHRDL